MPVQKELNEKPVLIEPQKTTEFVNEHVLQPSFSQRIEPTALLKEETTREKSNRKLIIRSLVAACLVLGGVIIGLAISYNRQQTNKQDLERLVKSIEDREKRNQQGTITKTNPVTPPSNPASNSTVIPDNKNSDV